MKAINLEGYNRCGDCGSTTLRAVKLAIPRAISEWDNEDPKNRKRTEVEVCCGKIRMIDPNKNYKLKSALSAYDIVPEDGIA